VSLRTSDFKLQTSHFLWILVVEAVLIAAAVTVALDIYAHQRVESAGGVNVWGYRGPVAHAKAAAEIRIVIVGGTRAYGWGQHGSGLTTELRRQIMLTTDRPGRELRPIVAINLGQLGALPESYPATLDHYAYLRPDYVCIYDDLGVAGSESFERSGVFALTGYAPALPLVLREKGLVWRFGDVERGYAAAGSNRDASSSFVRRTGGAVLAAGGDTLGAADRMMARLVTSNRSEASRRDGPASYVNAMMTAIDAAHRRARGVVVVLSPAEKPEQVADARALDSRLKSELEASSWLRIVDLGQETPLSRADSRVDGWNFGGAATALVAERIARAVLSFIEKP
jgi:hypothetical protein